jgi:hypothetical protein
MDSYDQLAIRACKSLYGERILNRLRKIYGKRIAVGPEHVRTEDMFQWLLGLLESFDEVQDTFSLIWDAAPLNRWKWGAYDASDHFEIFLHVVASRIRLMEVKYIPGYRSPRKFRGLTNSKSVIY